MGIRESLNQNPAITTGATAAIILVALGIIVYQLIGGSAGTTSTTNQAFYTIDDGKTWFPDDINKVPPFEKDGKKAYLVFVWTCNGGKTKFPVYLQRYTPEAKKKVEEARAKAAGADPAVMEMVLQNGIEVKLPGNGDDPKNWVKQNDPASSKITQPNCKDGKREDLEPVMP